MMQNISRRDFLEFMGKGSLVLSLTGGSLTLLNSCAALTSKSEEKIFSQKEFLSLKPTSADALTLARGLEYRIIATYGDQLNDKIRFGINNDFLHLFALPGKKDEALLAVNHESPLPLFIHGNRTKKKSKEEIEKEMACVGVCIVHIKKSPNGHWEVVKGSEKHRFID